MPMDTKECVSVGNAFATQLEVARELSDRLTKLSSLAAEKVVRLVGEWREPDPSLSGSDIEESKSCVHEFNVLFELMQTKIDQVSDALLQL